MLGSVRTAVEDTSVGSVRTAVEDVSRLCKDCCRRCMLGSVRTAVEDVC